VSTTVFDAATNAAWAGTESTGASAYDTSSVGGALSGFTPSGSVTYDLFANGTCSGSPSDTDTETLRADGSVPNSAASGALAAGSYSYRASYSGDSNYQPATGSCESFAVAGRPDLKLSASPDSSQIVVGEQDKVTDTVTNTGDGGATNVQFSDPAADFTINSATAGQGTCTHTAHTVSCSLGTLGAGQTVTVSILLTANSAGAITLKSSVSMDQTDPSPADNQATASIAVKPQTQPLADLAIDLTPSAQLIPAGHSFLYTITVSNRGPSNASQVSITDHLPSRVTAEVVHPVSAGMVCNGRQNFRCTLAGLAPSATASLTVKVRAETAGRIRDLARVSDASPTDPNPGNNTARAVVLAAGPPTVSLLPLTRACYTSFAVIGIRATATAVAGVKRVSISITGHGFHQTIDRARLHGRAPRKRNLQLVVKGSALTPGRTYRVAATVTDSLGRQDRTASHLKVCQAHSSRGFTG
jgi:uncharacterized repeat protein (TIGR01451 family)